MAAFLIEPSIRDSSDSRRLRGSTVRFEGMFVKAARGAPDDVWPALSAARIIGTDRPPAERLPDHMRRWLEEFAPQAPRR